MDPTIPPYNPLTGAGTADQIKARFRGKDRAGAKTTLADGTMEVFDTVEQLIATLPKDSDMKNHTPAIERDSDDRASEENRNVEVQAWIYAIKYEEDQDWHVIAGSDPSGKETYLNTEISGLPRKNAGQEPPAHKRLLAVRNALVKILDDDPPGPGSYRIYKDPIPVVIQGSLFFDVDHPSGKVGPTGMRPSTAWEIHPITFIALQPGA
jgi:hypothetical protein